MECYVLLGEMMDDPLLSKYSFVPPVLLLPEASGELFLARIAHYYCWFHGDRMSSLLKHWRAIFPQLSIRIIYLLSFKEGGIPPKFLIIDDGWQETAKKLHKEGQPLVEGTQFGTRLIDINEIASLRAPNQTVIY
ncbi:probable galactinol--sucrose galactosyltransferase 2 [Olea europaea subsp. europaea]|uniref:Probable galactinol--sucrose galactosyltransferase 2 n=1 Tax=Olea europaea subsp. europaea TaxID=158383 RepID=A0A8S0R4T1_OLEEU|nr:probable galactinol--sucrose galactosyltransferase 2 [Olea europaea subsp. europaea]